MWKSIRKLFSSVWVVVGAVSIVVGLCVGIPALLDTYFYRNATKRHGETLQEHEKTQRMILEANPTNHVELGRKYPYGYAIVYSYDENPVTHVVADSLTPRGLDVDLSAVEMTFGSTDTAIVMITLPSINWTYWVRDSTYRTDIHYDNRIGMSRAEGTVQLGARFDTDSGSVEVVIEVLINEPDLLVCAIGARKGHPIPASDTMRRGK